MKLKKMNKSERTFSKLTLKFQIISTSFILTLILVGLGTEEFLQFNKSLVTRMESIGRIIGRNIEPAISFNDPEEIKRGLSSLVSESYISNAYIMDSKNSIILKYPFVVKEELNKNIDYEKYDSLKYKMVEVALKEGETNLGRLILVSDLTTFATEFNRIILTLIICGFFSMLFFFFIFKKFNEILFRPFNLVLNTIKQISIDKNYRIKINLNEKDLFIEEIRYLSDEINFMLEQIDKSHKEIQHQNEHLEDLVHERTLQLDSERAKSIQSSKLAELGEMSAGIAHEINNPLAAIHGNSLVVKKMIEKGKVEVNSLSTFVEKNLKLIDRISVIIRGLKDFSRDASLDEMKKENLTDLIQDAMIFCESKLKVFGVKLDTSEVPTDFEFHCRGTQITQVILNLINNAIDALENNDEKWIKIEASKTSKEFFIVITDSGKGIDDKIQEKIFNPFFTTKEVGKGTGLGISISKNIMESHSGSIYLDNTCENTRFVLMFPNSNQKIKTA